MSEYHKPEGVENSMGGSGDEPDSRMKDVFDLLRAAAFEDRCRVLDVGVGRGQVALALAREGKEVTGIGLEIATYGGDLETLSREGVRVAEARLEALPFASESFDAVVLSHVLEHCPNVGVSLTEARRVLRTDGRLLVLVPPHEDNVCAGHVAVGWSVGQLMYVLLVHGFDIKDGMFVEHGYNVCAFVRKGHGKLPPLRFDRGDIHLLRERFPVPIRMTDGMCDGYWGKLKAVNWSAPPPGGAWPTRGPLVRLFDVLAGVLPRRARAAAGRLLVRIGRRLSTPAEKRNAVNPTELF